MEFAEDVGVAGRSVKQPLMALMYTRGLNTVSFKSTISINSNG